MLALTKGNEMTNYDFEMAWQSIYWTFQDNAFDYRGKPFFDDNEGSVTIAGKTYVEVPF
jgi:hypothetical protein